MKNILFLFLFLVPVFLFAQYPTGTNKSRLGYQTTGDGLIWRGVAADTAIKPRTTANAYFQLDTVNRVLRRYIATQGSWQVIGGGTNVDSLIYATRYWVNSNFFPILGGTLTGTGGAGFIGFPSQVSAPGTPASGLNVYAQGSSFNWKGTDGYERQFASTLTGGRTYTLPDASGTFTLGTGTADRSARWSATNTLGTGSWSDNLTRLQAQVPVQFQSVTTAGLPTGVTGYHVYNTTINGPGWYNGTRWAYALESTFARGTATRVPYFDANGQVMESGNLAWSATNRLLINNTSFTGTGLQLYHSANNTDVISGGPASENITFGPSNRIFLNAAQVYVSYIGNIGTIAPVNIGGTAGTALNITMPSSLLGAAVAQNAVNISAPVAQQGTGSSANILSITPTYNNTTTTNATVRGIYYNPTITSLTSTTHVAYQNTTGDVLLNSASGSTGIGLSTAPNYKLDISSTDAIGLPRGTVAQRPTIVSSTTPLRFNTDSTALEYGESVGTWRQLATRAYARSLVAGLPTVNIYTGDGNLGDNVTRTFSQGSNGDFIQYRTTTTDKRHKTYLSIPTGNADYDDEARVLYQSGGTKFRKISHYKAGGIYDGTGNYVASYTTSERNSADNYVLFEHYAQMGSGSTANFAGLLVGVDSTNSNAFSSLKLTTQNSASPKTHWAGLVDGSYGNGGWGNLTARIISYSPSFKVQTNTYNSNTYFDWLRIDNLDTDTTSNRISLYNGKYPLPNARPGTGNNLMRWDNGTPAFVEQKRDTTIYIDDSDYDFSAALTTAQIASRYNRIIFWMTTTGSAGSDSEITLHTPDANLMQVEYIIHSVDEAGGFSNVIRFGTNNAVDSTNGLVSSYFPAAGQGVHVRAGLRSATYKYRYY